MQIISICNQKGGCAKTTSTLNIASELAILGKKVLMIDADYQANLTASLGIQDNQYTLLDCFNDDLKLEDIIIKGELIENLDIVVCNQEYSNLNMAYADVEDNTSMLKKLIANSQINYDYIIIDCSPSLDLSVVNNLVASDKVIVPIEPSLFNIQGLGNLINIIKMIQSSLNPKIEISGILFTRVDSRTKLSAEFREELEELFKDELFTIEIHQSSAVARSQMAGLPLCLYDGKAKVRKEYENVAKEILAWE